MDIRMQTLKDKMVFESMGNSYFAGVSVKDLRKKYGGEADKLFSPEVFLDTQRWIPFLSIHAVENAYLRNPRATEIEVEEIRGMLQAPKDKVKEESYALKLNRSVRLVLGKLSDIFNMSQTKDISLSPAGGSPIATLAGIHHIWQERERVFRKRDGMGLLGNFMVLFWGICPPYIFTQREWEEYGGGEAMARPLFDESCRGDVFEKVFRLPVSSESRIMPGMVDQWTVLESYRRAKPKQMHFREQDLRDVFGVRRIEFSPSLALTDDILVHRTFPLFDSGEDVRPLDILATDLWHYAMDTLDVMDVTYMRYYQAIWVLITSLRLFEKMSNETLTAQVIYKDRVGSNIHRGSLFGIFLDIVDKFSKYFQRDITSGMTDPFNKKILEDMQQEGGYRLLNLIQKNPGLVRSVGTFLADKDHQKSFTFLFPGVAEQVAKHIMTLEAAYATGISPDEYDDETTLIR